MSLTQTWTLRAVYGTLFISVAVIFIVFAPRAPWPSKFWKPSFDIAHAQSTSPSASSSPLRPPPVWLIVTVSAAKNFARRDIVRATWQSLYKTSGLFDTRFVISNPGEALLPIIEYENRTHGDLIVLNVRVNCRLLFHHSLFCIWQKPRGSRSSFLVFTIN